MRTLPHLVGRLFTTLDGPVHDIHKQQLRQAESETADQQMPPGRHLGKVGGSAEQIDQAGDKNQADHLAQQQAPGNDARAQQQRGADADGEHRGGAHGAGNGADERGRGIDAGLDGTGAQDLGAEAVDGADVRFLETRDGVAQTALVGAVLGVGIARGIEAIDLRVVARILVSWVVTIPAGAFLAIIFFFIFKTILP